MKPYPGKAFCLLLPMLGLKSIPSPKSRKPPNGFKSDMPYDGNTFNGLSFIS